MRDKDELKSIALDWAYQTLDSWQDECGSWDYVVEEAELTEEEFRYCQSQIFNIHIQGDI